MKKYNTVFKETSDERAWYLKFENFISETRKLLQLGDKDEAIVAIVAECIDAYGGENHAKELLKNALSVLNQK